MGVYSGFKSYHYFNACACPLCGFRLSACLWSAWNNSVNTHQNQNPFLAIRSLISHAEVENAIIVLYLSSLKIQLNITVAFFFCFFLFSIGQDHPRIST